MARRQVARRSVSLCGHLVIWPAVWPSGRLVLIGRQHQCERRAFLGLRLDLDSAPEELGQAARNVEAETRAAVAAREGRVELGERLEQAIEIATGDADA